MLACQDKHRPDNIALISFNIGFLLLCFHKYTQLCVCIPDETYLSLFGTNLYDNQAETSVYFVIVLY